MDLLNKVGVPTALNAIHPDLCNVSGWMEGTTGNDTMLRDTTYGGTPLVFEEQILETAMRRFITPRHTIDEYYRKKRKKGFYIHIQGLDEHPFLGWNFVNWNNARFIVRMLELKIPELKDKLFIREHCSRVKVDGKFEKKGLPPTKYEVERLTRQDKITIWKNFNA